MKKCIYLLLLLVNIVLFGNEAPAPAKELKTLILIIATDDKPAYRELQKIWEAYMNSDPKHFEVYFLRGDPNLKTPYEIKKNEILVKIEESFAPGILNKTILGMEAMQPRLEEFDYVIRTNLSSFYPFDNLLKYLNTLPRKRCYCGVSLYQTKELGLPPEIDIIPFISGAGIILSPDLVDLLVKDHGELENYKTQLPDDVFMGLFFFRKKIHPTAAQRWDYPTHEEWVKNHHKIEDYAYHFRAKYGYNFRTASDPYKDELLTLKALLKKYYSID